MANKIKYVVAQILNKNDYGDVQYRTISRHKTMQAAYDASCHRNLSLASNVAVIDLDTGREIRIVEAMECECERQSRLYAGRV